MPINSESLAKAREDGFSEEQIFDYIYNEYDLGELTPLQALSDGYSYSQVNDYLATKNLQKLAAQPAVQPASEPEEERTFLGAVGEAGGELLDVATSPTTAAKALISGAGTTLLGAPQGLAQAADSFTNKIGLDPLLDRGQDNALINTLSGAEDKLQEELNIAPEDRDTGFAITEGVGQVAGAVALGLGIRALGTGMIAAAPAFGPAAPVVGGAGLLLNLAANAKQAANVMRAAGAIKTARAVSVAGTFFNPVTLTVGGGQLVKEQMQRQQQAEMAGIEIPEEDKDTANLLAFGLGTVSESFAAPLQILKKIPAASYNKDVVGNIVELLVDATKAGTGEAFEEAVQQIGQDAIERNIYNPDLETTTESLWDAVIVGGGSGAIADLVINAASKARYRAAKSSQMRYEEALRNEKNKEIELNERVIDQTLEESRQALPSQEASQTTPYLPSSTETQPVDPANIDPPESGSMDQYAFDLRKSLGSEFPQAPSFAISQVGEDGTPRLVESEIEISQLPEGQQPQFAVVDQITGQQYGKPLTTFNEAAQLAKSLDTQVLNANVSDTVKTLTETSETTYDPSQQKTMLSYGFKFLDPQSNSFTTTAIDEAAGTTAATGFLHEGMTVKELREQKIPQKAWTATQKMNLARLKKGLQEKRVFTATEVRQAIGDSAFSELGKISSQGIVQTPEVASVVKDSKKGFGVLIPSRSVRTPDGERLTQSRRRWQNPSTRKPFTEQEAKDFAESYNERYFGDGIQASTFESTSRSNDAFDALLNEKNIEDSTDSDAFKRIVEVVTGKKASDSKVIENLSSGERQLLYTKIASLPRFDVKTSLPVFAYKPYSRKQFNTAVSTAKEAGKVTQQIVADAIGMPRTNKVVKQLTADIKKQGITQQAEQQQVETEAAVEAEKEVPLLPSPPGTERRKRLIAAARRALDSYGLKDVALAIENALTNVVRGSDGQLIYGVRRRLEGDENAVAFDKKGRFVYGEDVDKTAEGYYSNEANAIFLGLDNIKTEGLTDAQIEAQILEILDHEKIHALRQMDLFTDKEWSLLKSFTTKKKFKHPETRKLVTFADWANEYYADLDPESRSEEAVAEMFRRVKSGETRLTGKPRTLIDRVIRFFSRMKSALRGTGFQSFEDVFADVESGEIGRRERGVLRSPVMTSRIPDTASFLQGIEDEGLANRLKVLKGQSEEQRAITERLAQINAIPDIAYSRVNAATRTLAERFEEIKRKKDFLATNDLVARVDKDFGEKRVNSVVSAIEILQEKNLPDINKYVATFFAEQRGIESAADQNKIRQEYIESGLIDQETLNAVDSLLKGQLEMPDAKNLEAIKSRLNRLIAELKVTSDYDGEIDSDTMMRFAEAFALRPAKSKYLSSEYEKNLTFNELIAANLNWFAAGDEGFIESLKLEIEFAPEPQTEGEQLFINDLEQTIRDYNEGIANPLAIVNKIANEIKGFTVDEPTGFVGRLIKLTQDYITEVLYSSVEDRYPEYADDLKKVTDFDVHLMSFPAEMGAFLQTIKDISSEYFSAKNPKVEVAYKVAEGTPAYELLEKFKKALIASGLQKEVTVNFVDKMRSYVKDSQGNFYWGIAFDTAFRTSEEKTIDKLLANVYSASLSKGIFYEVEQLQEKLKAIPDLTFGATPIQVSPEVDGKNNFIYTPGASKKPKGLFHILNKDIFVQLDNLRGEINDKTRKDLIETFNHEKLHAFKSLDLFTEKEWGLLVEEAKKRIHPNQADEDGSPMTFEQWAEKYYGYASNELKQEESIAEMLGTLSYDNASTFEKVFQFYEDVTKAKAATPEFTSFKEILSGFESGEIGRRPREIRTVSEDSLRRAKLAYSKLENDVDALQAAIDQLSEQSKQYGEISSVVTPVGQAQTMRLFDTLYSRTRPMPPTNSTFNAPSGVYGPGKKFIWRIQDKFYNLKEAELAVNDFRRRSGLPPIKTTESAYKGEESTYGKIGQFVRRFNNDVAQPIADKMNRSSVTQRELDEFLILRHAVERNERIRKINPNKQDAGAGSLNILQNGQLVEQELTDAFVKQEMRNRYGMIWNDATGTWSNPTTAKGRALDSIAQDFDAVVSGTLDTAFDGQLITENDKNILKGFYKYYAPLRGKSDLLEDVDAETDKSTAGSGGSLSILGKEFGKKRAKGRASEAFSPSATILADRYKTIARAVKNTEVGVKLIDMILNNPNDEFWKVIGPGSPEIQDVFDSTYTYVGNDPNIPYGTKKRDISNQPDKRNWVKRVKPRSFTRVLDANQRELLVARKDGQDYFIWINDPQLRTSLINLDHQTTNGLLNFTNKINRALSLVNTSLNPEFIISNAIRDFQTGLASILNEYGMKGGYLEELNTRTKRRKLINDVASFRNEKGVWNSGRQFYRYFAQKTMTPENKREMEEFLESGAKTDWFHSPDPEQAKKDLQTLMKIGEGQKFSPRAIWEASKGLVENVNGAVENAIRFATFRVTRDELIPALREADPTLSESEARKEAVAIAATMAKNMTINFNRKGEMGTMLNSLYLFFNASVQGSAVILRGITSSRVKQSILFGAITAGMLQALLWDWLINDEDEEEKGLEDVESFERERNLLIPKQVLEVLGIKPQEGATDYYKIPLPYGYNAFINLGSNLYMNMTGKMSNAQAMTDTAKVFLGSFNPIGLPSGEAALVRAAIPTSLLPVAELYVNQNYFGGPIYDVPFPGATEKVAAHRSFRNTAGVWKWLTEGANKAAGGNEFEPGNIPFVSEPISKLSPDALSYLFGYGLGGAGKFAERSFITLNPDKARELEINDIPFVRKLLGEFSDRPDTQKYYDRVEEVERAFKQQQLLLEEGRVDERGKHLESKIDLLRLRPYIQLSQKRLRALRKYRDGIEKRIEADPESLLQHMEELERIRDEIDSQINTANKFIDDKLGAEEDS